MGITGVFLERVKRGGRDLDVDLWSDTAAD